MIARIQEGTSVGEHFLIRLRIVHPIVASVVATGMMVLASLFLSRTNSPIVKDAVKWVLGLVSLQVILGVVNVLLCTGLDAAYSPARGDILWIITILLVVFEAEEAFRRAGPSSTSTFKEASLKRPLRGLRWNGSEDLWLRSWVTALCQQRYASGTAGVSRCHIG